MRGKTLQEYFKNIAQILRFIDNSDQMAEYASYAKNEDNEVTVSAAHDHTQSVFRHRSLSFLCSCLTISFMRRFKKSKLDVFVDSTEAGFVEKILMEVSIWKCLNYLILKTTYLSGLHF